MCGGMLERGAASDDSKDYIPAFNRGGNRCLFDDAESGCALPPGFGH